MHLPEGGRLTTLYRSFEDVPVRASVRFPLHLDIVLTTAERQYKAVTEDVSANGILFTADEIPEIGTNVEFELKMPVVGLEASAARYFCANFPDSVSIGVLMILPG